MRTFVSTLFNTGEEFEAWIKSIQDRETKWDNKACRLSVVGDKLKLLAENGDMLAEVDYCKTDNETIKVDAATGVITAVGIKEKNSGKIFSVWIGTQAQYDAIPTKDTTTWYWITNDETIQLLKNRITSLENRATALEERATALEAEAQSLDERSTDLEERATALEAEAQSLDERSTNLEERATNSENEISNIKDGTTEVKQATQARSAYSADCAAGLEMFDVVLDDDHATASNPIGIVFKNGFNKLKNGLYIIKFYTEYHWHTGFCYFDGNGGAVSSHYFVVRPYKEESNIISFNVQSLVNVEIKTNKDISNVKLYFMPTIVCKNLAEF